MDLQVVFLDHLPGPDPGHQLVFGNERAFRPGQYAQDLQCAVAQLQRAFVEKELAPRQIQAEPTEAERAFGHETPKLRPI